MTLKAPLFEVEITDDSAFQDAEGAIEYVAQALEALDWQGQQGGAGWGLVQLFGRLTELVTHRLNQVPDKHLLAFLNEARVDLLPPRPASTELVLSPAEDGPPLIRVPAGTQVTTVQTETQPEIIFETQRDIVVVPNTLIKCIALDPVNYSDRTGQATGRTPGSFAAFQGEQERERILYLGDPALFTFSDAASRQAAEIKLHFEFDLPGDPVRDGWRLTWLYWDGEEWAKLVPEEQVMDGTKNFAQDGKVTLKHLPAMTETEVDGQPGLWIACKLTGGSARNYLPALGSIAGSRRIRDLSGQGTAGAALSALQSGTAFVPLDTIGEFFPLGQHPGRLDTFYLRVDEAFSKPGATVTLQMDLEGVEAPQDTSELENLQVEWQYHGENGWASLGTSTYESGVISPQLGFVDNTSAFTASGTKKEINFRVPTEQDPASLFAETVVDGQKGYWVRARMRAGSYDEPGKLNDTWLPPKTHAPLVSNLTVMYSGFSEPEESAKPVDRCRSRVDGMWPDHCETNEAFFPFCAREEGPALYLGFRQAFPAGEWMQLLLDVDEAAGTSGARLAASWEYWDGGQWAPLRVSDGSQGLSERGYLGFFGPSGHQPSAEFGQEAYWLRACPPRSHPRPLAQLEKVQPRYIGNGEFKVDLDASQSRAYRCHRIVRYVLQLASSRYLVADAGSNQVVHTTGDEATVYLDASGSQAFDGEGIAQYAWRLVRSNPLVANAGLDQTVRTTSEEATVQLDASGSRNLTGGPIAKYIWRRIGPEEQEERQDIETPYLQAIRINTVPAINAVTIREEALGSSDGKPDQRFSLLRPPVLPGAQIAVQEPDRPPDEELQQLRKELQQVEEGAQVLLPSPRAAPGQGAWVRWHQVLDFDASGPASRHFTLDPISGQVQFGDGEQGRIPPVGRDNIKAVFYRTHDGGKANAAAGSITVLRNPSGDLANIKSAANPEGATGGSDVETVEEVKRRGPQSLKHRQRAVTVEDYAWLAQEASGEVAQAWCLPTRNREGLLEAGWVTVVILPESGDVKPTPSPALLRRVQAHLEDRALANLKEAGEILVRGPEYIEATALIQVKPVNPAKSDEVELAILKQLETFLHPLRGGPERAGWGLGRDVYLSEVCAEVEAVPGVDHIVGLRLVGSLLQHRLRLKAEPGVHPPFDLPVGSQVSTFDERIKLRLAEPVLARDELEALAVHGFKVGDAVTIVSRNNELLKDDLYIASLSGDAVTFDQSFCWPEAWQSVEFFGLLSTDGQLRLPFSENDVILDAAGERVTGVRVRGLQVGDRVSVVVGTRRDPALELLPIRKIELCRDRIFVPEGHLVYSGSHDIEMVLE